MDEAQIDRRIEAAKAQVRQEEKLDHLIEKVDDIQTTVSNLDCKKNTEKINILYTAHIKSEQTKQHFIKTAISQTYKAGVWVLAGAMAVYASIKG